MINQKEEESNIMLTGADMKEILDLEENKEGVFFIGEMEQFIKDNFKEDLCKVMVYTGYRMDKFMKENLEETKDMELENIQMLLEFIMVIFYFI
jgi:hypothetical protein